MSKPVYVVQVAVSENDLNEIVTAISQDLDEGDEPITAEEVKGNTGLLEFLCESAAEGGLYDIQECWNGDGFCGWEDYR